MGLTGLLWVAYCATFALIFYRRAKTQFVTVVEVESSDYTCYSSGNSDKKQFDPDMTCCMDDQTEYQIHDKDPAV